jgi:hypothetical protein
MLRLRRPAIALLLLAVLWPSLALGQPARVGVVTTLEGTVTATRAALPQPVPLRFKDDVFLQDRVVTGDRSLARMLLGGKAIVTVRERSSLTLTEVPGQSTIGLESGKIALAVAREKLRPGESVEVRTPNAVAGVRGTVVIAEVVRATAQTGAVTPGIVTRFFVVRGTIVAAYTDPGGVVTGQVIVNANENVTITGTAPPSVRPTTPQQQSEAQAGLQPSAPQHTQAANQEQVTQTAVNTTVALATALFGTGGEPQTQVVGSGTTTTTTTTTTAAGTTGESAPILPGNTSSLGGTEPSTAPPPPSPPPPPPPLTGLVTIPPGSALFQAGDLFTVPAGDAFPALGDPALTQSLIGMTDSVFVGDASFLVADGTLTASGTAPLVAVDPSVVSLAEYLVSIGTAGSVSLAGSLVDATDTAFAVERLLRVTGAGALGSTGSAPLVALLRSPVFSELDVLRIVTTASLGAGALLDAVESPLVAGSTALRVSITSATGAPVSVTGTSAADPFVALSLSPVVSPSTTLSVNTSSSASSTQSYAGGLALLSQSPMVGNDSTSISLFASSSGDVASITSPSAASLVRLDRSPTASTDSGIFSASVSGSTAGTLSVGGRLFDAVESPLLATGNTTLELRVSASSTGGTASLSGTGAVPLIALDRSPSVSFSSYSLVDLAVDAEAMASVTLGGPLLAAVSSPILSSADILFLDVSVCCGGGTASLTGATGQPLVTLGPRPGVTSPGSPVVVGSTVGSLVELSLESDFTASLALPGGALAASSSPILTGRHAVEMVLYGGSGVGAGATLTGGPSPFLSLTSSPLLGQNGGPLLVRLIGRDVSATFTGPLLTAVDSPIAARSGVELILLDLPGTVSGTLTLDPGGPLIALTRSPVSANDSLIEFKGATSVGTLSAPLLSATRSPIVLGDALFQVDNRLNATTTAALMDFAESPVYVWSFGLFWVGTSDGRLDLEGPLLTSDSPLLTWDSTLEISGTAGLRLSSASTEPLVSVTRIPLTSADGAFLRVGNGSGSLAGPLLDATNALASFAEQIVTISGGGALTTAPPATTPYPLVDVSGGGLAVAYGSSAGQLFRLVGTATAADGEPNPVAPGGATGLTLGTTEVLDHQGGAPVFRATGGATVQARGSDSAAFRLDTVLLETAVPLVSLAGGSTLTTSSSTLDLVNQARLRSLAGAGALVTLDHSTLNAGDHLADLTPIFSGSRLSVVDDFLRVVNRSAVNVKGALLAVSNGSVAEIGGALVRFEGAAGNVVNVTNALAPSYFLLGVPVHVAGTVPGGGDRIVIAGSPLVNLGVLGSIFINGDELPVGATSGMTGSLLAILGTGGTIKIDGAPPAFTAPSAPGATTPPAGTPLMTLAAGTPVSLRPGTSLAVVACCSEVPLVTLSLTAPFVIAASDGPPFPTLPDLSGSGGGPTLQFVDSSVAAGTTGSALFDVTFEFTAAGPLLRLAGGSLQSVRPLLDLAVSPAIGGALHLASGASATFMGADVVRVGLGGTLTVTGPLFSLAGASSLTVADAVPVTFVGNLVRVIGGTLETSASLVTAAGGSTLLVGRDLLRVESAGTFTSTTTDAVLSLTDSNLNAGRSGIVTLDTSSLSVQGPLVSATGSLLTLTDSLVALGNTTPPVFGGAGALVSLTGSPVTTLFDTLIGITASTVALISAGPDTVLTFPGPLLTATGSPITAASQGIVEVFACCKNSQIVATGPQPLVGLDASPAIVWGDLMLLATSVICSSGCPDLTGMTFGVSLAGPLLVAVDSPLWTESNGIEVSANVTCCNATAGITSTGLAPLVSLTRSPVIAVEGEFALLELFGQRAALDLAGPVLSADTSPLLVNGWLLGLAVTASPIVAGATATFTSTGTGSLLSLDRSPVTSLFGSLVDLTVRGFAASASLAGPLVSALDSPIVTGDDAVSLHVFANSTAGTSASFTKTGSGALISLDRSPLTVPDSRLVDLRVESAETATLSLAGPLLAATDSPLATGSATIDLSVSACCGGTGTLTSSGGGAFLQLARSPVTGDSAFFAVFVSGSGGPATAAFAGPLLSATDSPIAIDGDGLSLDVFATGSATLTASGTGPFVTLVRSPVTSMFDTLLSLDVSGASPTLGFAGPLLAATDSPLYAGEGDLIEIRVSGGAGTLTSTTTLPFVSLERSPATARFDPIVSICCTLTMTLAGPLLAATGSPLTSDGDDIIYVTGAAVSSTTTSPFLSFVGSPVVTTDGGLLYVSSGSLSLAGPLLATDTLVRTYDSVIELSSAMLTSSTTSPLLSLGGVAVTSESGSLLRVTGGTARVSLMGPLLTATNSVLTSSTGLVRVGDLGLGGRLATAASGASPYPVVALDGGQLIVDGFGGALFALRGVATAADPDLFEGAPTGLTLGTDEPLEHGGGGPVLDATNAANIEVNGANGTAFTVDRALLEASAPLLLLRASAALTTAGNAIDLVGQASVKGLGDALIKLDAAALTVRGHLVNVAGGSRLAVTGDLLRMANGSAVTLGCATCGGNSGLLLNVTGGSIASITGVLVNMLGAGNTLNVTNTFAPTGFVAGIPVFSALGGTTGFTVTSATPLAGLNTAGTININGTALPTGATGGVTGSLIAIQGTGTVKIGP